MDKHVEVLRARMPDPIYTTDITTSGGEFTYGWWYQYDQVWGWKSEVVDHPVDLVYGAHATFDLKGTYTLCHVGFEALASDGTRKYVGCRGRIMVDDVVVATWDEADIRGHYEVPLAEPVTGSTLRFDFDELCVEEERHDGPGYRLFAREGKAWTCDTTCKNYDGGTHQETFCDTCHACFEHGCHVAQHVV